MQMHGKFLVNLRDFRFNSALSLSRLTYRSTQVVYFGLRSKSKSTRWAPTSFKWNCKPYKWPYQWVAGVITYL